MKNPLNFILTAVLIALLAGAFYFYQAEQKLDTSTRSADYQAVFLSNGQVYFGHVASANDEWVELNDIYYLQLQNDLQGEDALESQDITLIKLGNELHGPTDSMDINKDQILFIEDLKDSSRVVSAIYEHKGQ